MAISSDILDPLKSTLDKSQDILVLLTQNAGQEMVAGGLGLYQVLTQAGKNVQIACPTKISDSSRKMPGGNEITQKIGNRNLVISLKVTENDSIDKVSYNLDEETKTFNLIIQPKKGNPPLKQDEVSYSYSGATADLIFIFGANRLEDLGLFYENERALFTQAKTVSLHRFAADPFADYQIIDPNTSGFGELAFALCQHLNLTVNQDAATIFLTGIDLATNHLQNHNLKPDSLEHMAQLLRLGGSRQPATPNLSSTPDNPKTTITPEVKPTPEAPKSAPVPQEWLTPKIYKSNQPNQA